jgi:hypothetical protein
MDNELTFGGYPIEYKFIDDEIYIVCKGVEGKLSDIEKYLKDKSHIRHYFGKSKIRSWNRGMIKIDCLEETVENFIKMYNYLKELKNEQIDR